MRRLRLVLGFGFVVGSALALTCAEPARAESSIWERARDPRAARVDRALRRLELALDGASQSEDRDMIADFQEGALLIAEMTGARALGDPRLSVLVANALLTAGLDREREAAELLERALSDLAAPAPWLEAEILPLLAAAARADAARAVTAVDRALPLVWDEAGRAFLLVERAEAKMALGEVRASVRDARLSLSVARGARARALSRFWLGLGLERSGDLPAALAEMRLARLELPAGDPDILDDPDTFALRPLDADYAAGLAGRAMAEAEGKLEPKRALSHYAQALWSFARYVKAAPSDDRWLASARAHHKVCERALGELKKKLGAESTQSEQEPPP